MKYGNPGRLGWGGRTREGLNASARGRFPQAIANDEACPRFRGTGLLRKTDEVKTMSNIAERVKKIVVEHLGVEPEKVTESASFIDDLGADSLDTVELVMAFEEEFGCEIPDDAAETILTVGDAVKFLEKNAKS
jgi:acyl carrier protein